MSPQVHWKNRIQEVTVKDVSARALHDGNQVAILLEYSDPTQDPDDAAALEFMVGDKKAHFAHGQPMLQVEGGPVNIWFWKNKTNKAVDMSAKGFGTLKPQEHQDVKAKGVYSNGTWKIVFSRALSTGHRRGRCSNHAGRIHQYRVCSMGRTKRWRRRAGRKRLSKSRLILVVFPSRCTAGLFQLSCMRRSPRHWPWGFNLS